MNSNLENYYYRSVIYFYLNEFDDYVINLINDKKNDNEIYINNIYEYLEINNVQITCLINIKPSYDGYPSEIFGFIIENPSIEIINKKKICDKKINIISMNEFNKNDKYIYQITQTHINPRKAIC